MANAGKYTDIVDEKIGNVHTLTLGFTTDVHGTVSIDETAAVSIANFSPLGGQLQRIIVTPTDLSDLFDMKVLDTNDVDILNSGGANLTNTEATVLNIANRTFVSGEFLRPQVTDGGNGKKGTVKIYYMLG